MKKSLKITDISYNFLPHPVTGNVSLVKNKDAIKQSIKTLLFLNLYEKPYNADINVGLKYYLFENINIIDSQTIKENIRNVLETYETRIILNSVELLFVEKDNSMGITINYTIVAETKEPDNVTLIFGRSR